MTVQTHSEATEHLAESVDGSETPASQPPVSQEWSTRRATITGGIAGAFFGVVFFAGYAATSAWICSSSLDCGHWAPIAIVSGSGAAAFTVLGAAGGYLLRKVYRLFKVV